jgi:hypothetical protein
MRSEPTLDKPHQYSKRHSIEDRVETSEALEEKPLTNAETDAMLSFMQLWHCCHFKYDGIRLKHY